MLIARTRALDESHVCTLDLSSDPALVAHTRSWATRQLVGWGLEELSFVTALVVSELVTNAIRYGHVPLQWADDLG